MLSALSANQRYMIAPIYIYIDNLSTLLSHFVQNEYYWITVFVLVRFIIVLFLQAQSREKIIAVLSTEKQWIILLN